ELARHRDADPAARDDLLERLPEAVRGGHAAVGAASAPLRVADPVERGEHVLAIPGRFAQDRGDEIGRGVGKAGQVGVALDGNDIAEQKQDVIDGGFVDRHQGLLRLARCGSTDESLIASRKPFTPPLRADRGAGAARNTVRAQLTITFARVWAATARLLT